MIKKQKDNFLFVWEELISESTVYIKMTKLANYYSIDNSSRVIIMTRF
jgi:hypothetical protein